MNRQQKSLALTVFLTLLFFFSGAFVSITPMPVVYALLQRDERSFWKVVLPCVAFVAAVYGFLVPPLTAMFAENAQLKLLFTIPFLELGSQIPAMSLFVLGVCYHSFFLVTGYAIYLAFVHYPSLFRIISILIGVTTGVALLLFLGLTLAQSGGLDLTQMIADVRGKGIELLEQVTAELAKNPQIDVRDVFWLRTNLEIIIDHDIFLGPSWLAIMISTIVLFNLVLCKRFFMLKYPGLILISLTRFRTHFAFVWVFILALSLSVATYRWMFGSWQYYLVLNFFIGVTVLFFWQGIAVLMDYLDVRRVSGLFRLLIYFTIFSLLFPVFFISSVGVAGGFKVFFGTIFCFAILGVVDSFFDFRKLESPPDQDSGGKPGNDDRQRDPDLVKMIWGNAKDSKSDTDKSSEYSISALNSNLTLV